MQVNVSYSQIWKISFPLIIGLVAQNILNVTDTAFLGQVGPVALGSAAIGGLFYLALLMLGVGFGTGSQILIGRRNGEKKFHEIGNLLNQCLIFEVFLGVILFIIMKFLSPILLRNYLTSTEIINGSLEYLDFRLFGLFFALINIAFGSFYIGTINTKVMLITTAFNALLNVLLDYLLIFGHWGFPQMGIGGAALATSISEFASSILFILLLIKKKNFEKYHLFKHLKVKFDLLKPLVKVASPVMLINFLSFTGWFIFFLLIESMGVEALAISNIGRSIYMVLMIPLWGLSASTNTLVSNLIGQGDIHKVFELLKKIIILSLIATVFIITSTIFIAEPLIKLYTDNAHLVSITKPVFYVIETALLFFSVGIILFQGVSGTGNTKVSLLFESLNILLYVGLTILLSKVFLQPIHIVWTVEIWYFISLGTFSFLYLKYGKWRKLRI